MIWIKMLASGALVKAADVTADLGIANLAQAKSSRARCRNMVCRRVHVMFDLDHLITGTKAAAMPGIDCRRMEVADDDRRAVLGDARELGISSLKIRQVAEHEATPDDVE